MSYENYSRKQGDMFFRNCLLGGIYMAAIIAGITALLIWLL